MTPQYARSIFEYCEETGLLRWKERPIGHFQNERIWKAWNARYAGRLVSYIAATGYHRAIVDGKGYLAHRLIWLMRHGEWPEENIDHIDGDRTNNRLNNLRAASYRENSHNRAKQRNNSSGAAGVCRHRSGRWRAYISSDRRQINLGIFDTLKEAIAARKAAERRLGFHPNHGRNSPRLKGVGEDSARLREAAGTEREREVK